MKQVSVDEDSITTTSVRDQWGRFSETRNSYSANETFSRVQYTDRQGRDTAVYVDTLLENGSAAPIRLMTMTYNDLDQEVERWKVDYGTIRMTYDLAGHLRLMQNDKRKIENSCVYYKYDESGRKIEEGLLLEADSLMTQANADIRSFPTDTAVVDVKYRWFYDYFAGNDTLISPGRLVRVESEDTLYYRNFFYDPVSRTDSVIVRLPMEINPYKKIVHEYFDDGSLQRLTVYPRKTGSTWVISEKRVSEYSYDEAGRLSKVSRPEAGDNSYSYAEYEYDATGKLTQKRLGVDHRAWILIDPPYFVNWDDTLQTIDYTYNALGMLTGINWPDTSTVDSSISGYGDHFGLRIEYFDTTNAKYYNGRVRQIASQHSEYGNSLTEHAFEYDYMDIGWLRSADYAPGGAIDSLDRVYTYDAFGRRRSMTVGGSSTIDYIYYSQTDGSSRLQSFTGMGSESMIYDTLGNLVADSSRPIYLQTYEYRNLLEFARAEKNLATSPPTTLDFLYDESGQRIQKVFTYYYMDDCGVDTGGGTFSMEPGGGASAMGSGGGGGLEQCPFPTYTELNYLYDGGQLIATFASNGNVANFYVNGNGERLGHYEGTITNQMYYYLTDHLGSPRVIIADSDDTLSAPIVTSVLAYYPFGELLQSWSANPGTIHQFTGHEKDEHSSFDYHYFGARYYDARLGMFTSIDKASQFASGYVYGANNPIMGVDPDGNLFGFLVPLALAALKGAAAGAVISGATYSVYAEHWRWDGFLPSMLSGAKAGAISGGITASIGGISNLKGAVGTAVNSGAANMAKSLANGFSGEQSVGFFASGFATGLFGGSGGFGMARDGFIGKMYYSAITSTIHSVGDNLAAGEAKPFRDFTFALGPINLRMKKGRPQFLWRDNMHWAVTNAVGLSSVLLPSGDSTHISFDWQSLSFNYQGGYAAKILRGYGYGAYSILNADPSSTQLMEHERTHIWQSRAMGDLFFPTYFGNSVGAALNGGDYYLNNWFEEQARHDPF